jgi:hypothetical protein
MHGLLTRALPLFVPASSPSRLPDGYARRPSAADPHPLVRHMISATAGIWHEYVEHEFVRELGKGTLDERCFKHFIMCALPPPIPPIAG